MSKVTANEQFSDWLDYMPDFIEDFRLMMKGTGGRFDFSPESLSIVEEWILDRYSSTDEMLPTSESPVVNLLACYIGESMLRQRGGKWDIQLNPGYAFFGVPVVVLPNGDVECPLTLATTAADRRTGDIIRSVVCGE
jgi:hypothetical protein